DGGYYLAGTRVALDVIVQCCPSRRNKKQGTLCRRTVRHRNRHSRALFRKQRNINARFQARLGRMSRSKKDLKLLKFILRRQAVTAQPEVFDTFMIVMEPCGAPQ